MLRVGITGGIGSGKTTVAKIFESLHIPVFYSDIESKILLDSAPIIMQLVDLFGSDILQESRVDRMKLGQLVFTDPIKLNALNNIIHPAVEIRFLDWIKKHKGNPYVLKESALFFEQNIQKQVDHIILVTAPLEEKINRIRRRDPHLREENISDRMKHQWSDEQKIPLADFIIKNDPKSCLIEQVLKIHKALLTN